MDDLREMESAEALMRVFWDSRHQFGALAAVIEGGFEAEEEENYEGEEEEAEGYANPEGDCWDII